MDRVRFGRALGQGAREAGKALWKAADAATSPDPRGPSPQPLQTRPTPAQAGTRAAAQLRGVKRGSKRFGEAMWGPVARASGVVWLEVTGLFFGLFAVTAAIDIGRHRRDFFAHSAVDTSHRLWFAIGMFVLFGYFSVSSFVRAHQRGKR